MKFDSQGYLVSTQVASGQVLRIDPRSGEQRMLAALNPGLDNLTFVGDRLFVSNFTGEITEILGGGETRSVLPGGLNWPLDLAVGDDGNLYVADGTYFYVVGADGSLQTVSMLFTPGYPGFLRGLAPAGPGAFVVTTSGGQIARYRPADGETEDLADGFDQLYGVAIGPGDSIVFAELGAGRVHSLRSGNTAVLASGLKDPVGVAFGPDGSPLVAESGAGRVVRLAGTRVFGDGGRRTATAARHPGLRRAALHRRCRRQGADRLRSEQQVPQHHRFRSAGRAAARRTTQAAEGNATVLRSAGTLRGYYGRYGRHVVCVGRRRRQRAGIATPMTVTPADHRYLQVARTLRREIVDGVYPVGSQLPTEHELCERFAVSRYTIREALRRLRDDNLVLSRPRAGTLVVPRPTTNSYSQDVMSINDLLAFAAGAQFAIESNAMVAIDENLSARTGLQVGTEWLAVRGYRQSHGDSAPVCQTEYYINRTFAAVGRLLQRHSGPIFPLIEDLFGVSIVEVHQEISAISTSVELAGRLHVGAGTAALEMQRTYKTSDGEVAQVTINTHPSSRFRHAMTMRRVKG